ncbi:MAG TPA: hypothetical protein DCX27_06540 [Balneola sp.]|nr:hypothetical protein [Balneola sp.]|tara:strand:+ start:2860 stop:3276 length:417 start_codon:yes stop_codon:yes gene_type:complete
MDDIRQLKLSTGEEIVCQILDWADEEAGDLVIRHAYRLYTVDDDVRGYRLFSIKPWMTMQEGDDMFITMNIMNIAAQAKPSQKIEKQFWNAVQHSNMTEAELNQKLEQYISRMQEHGEDEYDEELENVITFPGSDKIH